MGSMMKRIANRFMTLVTLVSFTMTFACPPMSAAEVHKTEIPAGTIALVQTNTDLNPAELKVGDTVMFTVTDDVIVEGKIVIKRGAKALGEVTTSKENNYIGIPGKMGISIRSIQLADGSSAQVIGSKLSEGKDKMLVSIGLSLICCILFALMKGGPAKIAAGTQIQATLAGTSAVTVN